MKRITCERTVGGCYAMLWSDGVIVVRDAGRSWSVKPGRRRYNDVLAWVANSL